MKIKRKTIERAYGSIGRIKIYVRDAVMGMKFCTSDIVDLNEIRAYLKSTEEDINNIYNFIVNVENKNNWNNWNNHLKK